MHEGRVILISSAMEKHPPKVGLSVLDRLSVEIPNCIISILNIAAVHRFKAVNKRAFQAVNSHPQFRLLV